jgi:polyphosphate kinase
MCCLRPGLPGISENITVISVIGRFLEHSRIFWFANGGSSELFIGSADWMGRNLDRRVEAVTPIEDVQLKTQLETLVELYLNDSASWHMEADGSYQQRQQEGDPMIAQQELMARWRGGLMPSTSPAG